MTNESSESHEPVCSDASNRPLVFTVSGELIGDESSESHEPICSDASNRPLPQLDDYFSCLRSNLRWAPKALEFRVRGKFVDTDQEDFVTVLVVPTSIRVAHDYYKPGVREEHQHPEYEFEGWLLGDYPRKTWVRIEMRGTAELIEETTLYRLEPGEEMGDARRS
ncbi:hypothetical protein ACWGAN_04340 [Streptomyces sp. NPDC054945]